MGGDPRVSRVIAKFWAAIQGARATARAIPDDTDEALAAYLAKHKIGVLVEGTDEMSGLVNGRTIADMIGEEITKAWEKLDQAEAEGMEEGKWKQARGRIRGLAHSIAIMRSAPHKVTVDMIREIEEEFHTSSE